MLFDFRSFLLAEDGAISLDWVVLTAVILGTGLAVSGSVTSGIESVSVQSATQLRGQVIRQSFGSDICENGIDGLREREAMRVASGGVDPVNVLDWLSTYGDTMSDGALLSEQERLASANTGTPDWTRDKTLQILMECAIEQRGLT